jgi:hypothetical protein
MKGIVGRPIKKQWVFCGHVTLRARLFDVHDSNLIAPITNQVAGSRVHVDQGLLVRSAEISSSSGSGFDRPPWPGHS